ncbi:hypothetical protein [Glutamicibacter sp.]|uniref:hypothetical protein n=1 Tax=Glutamicibacter sp. TaxID=1931995 RepID=UPI002FE08362
MTKGQATAAGAEPLLLAQHGAAEALPGLVWWNSLSDHWPAQNGALVDRLVPAGLFLSSTTSGM